MNKTLSIVDGSMSTTEMDKWICIGPPAMVDHLVRNYALSYPLLKLAKFRKGLSKETYAKIKADMKCIRDYTKEELIWKH